MSLIFSGVLPRTSPLTMTVAPDGWLSTSRMPESRIRFSCFTSGVLPENLTSVVRDW